MSNTLVFSGVSKKTLAIIAVTIGVLFVAMLGIRYAAAVAPSDYGLHEGDTVSAAGSDDPDVYIVNEQGYKRLFLNPAIFGFYGHLGGFAAVKSITPATRDAFPTSGLFRNCETNDLKVYGVETTGEDTGNLHWVNTTGAQAVADDANFFKKVFCINTSEFNWYAKSATDYTSVSQVPSYVRVPGVTPGVPGALTVGLAPGNPGAATVTTNAQGVEYLRVRLSGTGTVTGLTVKRLGAGSVDDFDNVYVYDGARRLVSGKSFSSSTGTATFIGLNTAVSGTKDLSIVGDLSATAGNVNYMQVATITLSSGSVSGLPVGGNYITVSGATSGTVTVTKTGSIGNPTVGQANAHLSEFKISANTEAASVKRIQMIQGGTVKPSDITNLKLKVGSNEWSGTINSAGEMVFDLGSGYTITKGGNAIFDVYGDVAGKKAEIIALYFEYATDVLAIGDQYGYGMAATVTAVDSYTAGSSTESFELTLQGGVLTISFTGPTAADIGTSTDDTVFLRFSMAAAANIELRKTRLDIATDYTGNGWDAVAVASVSDIDDIKIVNEDTGAVLCGPVDGSSFTVEASNNPDSTGSSEYAYTDTIDLSAGQTIHVKVTGDVKTANAGGSLTGDSKVAFILENYADSVGLTEMKYSGTNTALAATDIVPNANVAGPAMTIKSSALSLALASSPADQTVVQGQTSVDAVGITFTATNASALKVTDITLSGYSLAAATGTGLLGSAGSIGSMVSSVALYEKESGALISSSPTSTGLAAAAGTVVFNGLNWNIPAGSSKTLLVRANLLNLAPPTNYYFYFDIAAITDVTALDNSSNSVNSGNAAPNGGTTVAAATALVTYTSAGSIYVTEYESSPSKQKHSVYWGQTGVTLAQFKLRSTNEGFYIDKFNLVGSSTFATFDKANIKSVQLSYLDKAGNTVVTSAQSLNAVVTPSVSFGFTGDSRPYIPKDTSRVISVKVDTVATYQDGATAGPVSGNASISLAFSGRVTDEFEATGEGSMAKVLGAVVGKTVGVSPTYGAMVYRAFPKIVAVSLPDGATSGQSVVGKFDIMAMGGDVLFGTTAAGSGSLEFATLSSGDASSNTYVATLYDDAAGTVLDTVSVTGTTNNASVSFTSFDNALSITAGTTKRVKIVANLVGYNDPVNTTTGLGADYYQLYMTDGGANVKWVDSHGVDANLQVQSAKGYLESFPAYGPYLTAH